MDELKTTLLIVEDDERTVEELKRILKNHTNFEIVSAAMPSQAIKIAENKKIEMALIDLKLPEMSGLELVTQLKKINPDLLVTMMTGYGEEETPIIAKEKGVVDFVEKPLNLQYLLATLNFQEREVSIRRTLRNAATLLQKFFAMIQDGVVMKEEETLLVSNPKGIELYNKYQNCEEKKIKDEGRHYEHLVSKSGPLVFHHFRDITSAYENSRSETQSEMAKMVVHELHNSITPIKLWLQEILTLDPKNESFTDTVKKAASEGILQIERLENLTRKFKEISKEKVSKIENVKIAPLISRLLSSVYVLLKEKEIILIKEVKEGIEAQASEPELYQILYNIILNSIEAFQKKGGKIKIEAKKDQFVLIKISDNAGGLPDEIAKNLFSTYLTTKESGSGLGLVLSKMMAQKMGGDLLIKNIKGVGVEVELKLLKATDD